MACANLSEPVACAAPLPFIVIHRLTPRQDVSAFVKANKLSQVIVGQEARIAHAVVSQRLRLT